MEKIRSTLHGAVLTFLVIALGSVLTEIGVPVYGLFYAAPQYDIPALYACLATLVTTIYFVTSAETKFYLKYEQYFNSLNFQGTISTVHEAREEMLTVLWSDAIHGAIIQFLFTVGMLSIGLILFERLQPGFTMQMKNYYIILSLAYGIYATANMLSLYSTYFADYRSVMIDTMVFAITSTVMCFFDIRFSQSEFYGIGFLLGCFLFLVVSYVNLRKYTENLEYEVLSLKPFVPEEPRRTKHFIKLKKQVKI